MLNIILAYCTIQAFTLFCSGKDATSYLLKDQSTATVLTHKRIKRWHRDGVVIWLMFVGAICWKMDEQYLQIMIMALLIRLGSFDIGFNKWAQLPIGFLGSTATLDRLFVKIFGYHGAVKKAIAFTILSVAFTYYTIKTL